MEKYLISNPEKSYYLGVKIYNNSDLDDNFRTRLLFSLLNVCNQTRRFSEAIHYGTEGLSLAEQANNNVLQVKFLGILGNIYQSLQVNDKAKYYLNKAEDILEKIKLPSSVQHIKGNILYLKGMNYAYTLDCDIALEYFDQAISVYRSANNPLSKMNVKLAYLNKANCLIEMNNLKDAEIYLNLSKVNYSESDLSSGIHQIYSNVLNQSADLSFARILALRNDFNQSNKMLLYILKLQDKTNISETDIDTYFQLSQNFSKLREIEKSKYYDVLYEQKMAEKNKIQVEVLNNLLLQDQKNADQKMQEQNNKILKWCIIVILFSSVLLLILTITFRKIKRANVLIEKDLYSSGN
ncbi:hypothetical protein [Chryseobacterium sp. ISL-6]|uniref:hypothetical protein n=1 Tax=Chryseobacterium sp. ISL-6 TaxID=2819143 RepID=UPI001BEA7B35|nr:hypothetical protein [Chryseobacterium sp. ISL-6]MBT2620085.1 hypothetical protein [Chryseobacterium sp. ISL-6]